MGLMYAVVSRWDTNSGDVASWQDRAAKLMDTIRSWDGVENAFNVQIAPNSVLAVITYRDQPTYDRLINDPNGPFAQAAEQFGLEKEATWIWSERGEVL